MSNAGNLRSRISISNFVNKGRALLDQVRQLWQEKLILPNGVGSSFHITYHNIQGVSKKRYFCDFLSYFSSRGRILLFHMCFGIRISSPFHLAFQKVSIQNLNCPKNACADMIFIPAQSSLRKAGIKIMSAHAFLGQLRF